MFLAELFGFFLEDIRRLMHMTEPDVAVIFLELRLRIDDHIHLFLFDPVEDFSHHKLPQFLAALFFVHPDGFYLHNLSGIHYQTRQGDNSIVLPRNEKLTIIDVLITQNLRVFRYDFFDRFRFALASFAEADAARFPSPPCFPQSPYRRGARCRSLRCVWEEPVTSRCPAIPSMRLRDYVQRFPMRFPGHGVFPAHWSPPGPADAISFPARAR